MTIYEAIQFIRPAIVHNTGTWADIGAGTGLFTEALMDILEEGRVIAVDKSPHSLYANSQLSNRNAKIDIEIIEGDFHNPMPLPPLDGILMANALHYAKDHEAVLKNVLVYLKPTGTFVLIEYDTDIPNNPWVPNPISIERFKMLCEKVELKAPIVMGMRESIYQDGQMYIAVTGW